MTGVTAGKTVAQIVLEIDGHIKDRGGPYDSWYVGIASDPEDRLFVDHKVKREEDFWIYRSTANSDIARSIEQHFLGLGCDGGPGGGDAQTRAVYAYKKASHTNP